MHELNPWMGILNDAQIEALCQEGNMNAPMIRPFLPPTSSETYSVNGEERTRKIISRGNSSFGYDITLSNKELKVFTNIHSAVVDPRKMDPSAYSEPLLRYDEEDGAEYVLLPPNTGMLGHTVEYFQMPNNVVGICQGKSTYARALISVIVTPLEPGWHGNLVVEIVNNTSSPVRIYTNQGIAQVNFFRGLRPKVTYADRNGKYMAQVGTVDAKV